MTIKTLKTKLRKAGIPTSKFVVTESIYYDDLIRILPVGGRLKKVPKGKEINLVAAAFDKKYHRKIIKVVKDLIVINHMSCIHIRKG